MRSASFVYHTQGREDKTEFSLPCGGLWAQKRKNTVWRELLERPIARALNQEVSPLTARRGETAV